MKNRKHNRGFSCLEVVIGPNESAEKAIKRFTKLVRNDGILKEVYDRRSYIKPSQKKRKKHSRAIHTGLAWSSNIQND